MFQLDNVYSVYIGNKPISYLSFRGKILWERIQFLRYVKAGYVQLNYIRDIDPRLYVNENYMLEGFIEGTDIAYYMQPNYCQPGYVDIYDYGMHLYMLDGYVQPNYTSITAS